MRFLNTFKLETYVPIPLVPTALGMLEMDARYELEQRLVTSLPEPTAQGTLLAFVRFF